MSKSIIEATLVSETEKSQLFDCEGDKVWFPKSQISYDAEKQELEVPDWLLRKTFPKENF